MKDELYCSSCGSKDVKIYRIYGNFYRTRDNKCNDCIEDTSWMVPCIMSDDGDVWGYASVSKKDLHNFHRLPEKNYKKPIWDGTICEWRGKELTKASK